MKEEILKFLEINYWTSGRDNDLISNFIEEFFNQYQPERSKREDDDFEPDSFVKDSSYC